MSAEQLPFKADFQAVKDSLTNGDYEAWKAGCKLAYTCI